MEFLTLTQIHTFSHTAHTPEGATRPRRTHRVLVSSEDMSFARQHFAPALPQRQRSARAAAGFSGRAAVACSDVTSNTCKNDNVLFLSTPSCVTRMRRSGEKRMAMRGASSSSSSSSKSKSAMRASSSGGSSPPPSFDPDDVEGPEPQRADDYADWRNAKDDETEAFKRAAAAAGREDDFVVGAKPLDESLLSRVMLQLLQNHTRGVPAAALLDKVKGDMCLDGYKSVLVGIGRTRQWALAREVVEWVRAQGIEQGARGSEVLTSNWFVALIRRRVDDKEWEAAVEVFEYMRDFGGVPSGECIEMFAQAGAERVSSASSWVAGRGSVALRGAGEETGLGAQKLRFKMNLRVRGKSGDIFFSSNACINHPAGVITFQNTGEKAKPSKPLYPAAPCPFRAPPTRG